MTDEEAFQSTCLAQPQEDLAKLVYADWLEDQGRSIEAWRIRTYLQVYRSHWQTRIRWKGRWSAKECNYLIRSIIRFQAKDWSDDLWRLILLTLIQAILKQFAIHVDEIPWQRVLHDPWDTLRYQHTLAVAECRVLFSACASSDHLAAAERAAQRAKTAVDAVRSELRPALNPETEAAWHAANAIMCIARQPVPWRDPLREAEAAAWAALQTVVVAAGWAARSGAVAEKSAWAAAYSLLSDLVDHRPAW